MENLQDGKRRVMENAGENETGTNGNGKRRKVFMGLSVE